MLTSVVHTHIHRSQAWWVTPIVQVFRRKGKITTSLGPAWSIQWFQRLAKAIKQDWWLITTYNFSSRTLNPWLLACNTGIYADKTSPCIKLKQNHKAVCGMANPISTTHSSPSPPSWDYSRLVAPHWFIGLLRMDCGSSCMLSRHSTSLPTP